MEAYHLHTRSFTRILRSCRVNAGTALQRLHREPTLFATRQALRRPRTCTSSSSYRSSNILVSWAHTLSRLIVEPVEHLASQAAVAVTIHV